MKKVDSNKERVVYFDILNILAIIAVVALHCNGIVHNYSYENQKSWTFSLIVECVFFWAVPVFIMLSGATLMNYRSRYTTKEFFKKRVLKVLIPFAFWAIFVGVWKYSRGLLVINDFSIMNILNIFFTNAEEPIYYFMFDILGIYMTIPVLSVLAEEKNRKLCWYTVILMFVTISFLPVVLSLFGIKYPSSFSIQFGGLIIFVLLGYLLSTEEINRKHRIIIYILGLLSIIFRFAYTYFNTISSNELNGILFNYVHFYSVLLACAVFVFIKYNFLVQKISNEKFKKIISKVAACSFGIFLIHKIVMHYEIRIFSINEFSIWWRTLGILSTYLISLILVYIGKKIPYVKKILP